MTGSSRADQARELPWFNLDQLPPLTAFAASVYATMHFPRCDEELNRFKYAQAIGLDWRARYAPGEAEESLPILRRELFGLLEFTKEFSQLKLQAKQTEGISAGYLLKYVLLLDRDTTVEVPSMKKAISLLVKYEPVSERTLQARWTAFNDVSHLWAALSDFRTALQKVGPEWELTAWLSFMKDPRPVVATAEHYRRWGTQHQLKGSRGYRTLDPATAWSVPASLGPLPSNDFLNPEQLYSGLTKEARELLERYRR